MRVVSRSLQQELHRAGIAIADGPGRGDRGLSHPGPQPRRERRRRALFDHLLMAALRGAVALEQVHHVSVVVRQDLDFDVPRVRHQALDVEGIVTEGGPGFVARPGDRDRQIGLLPHRAHALSATARRGFHEQGVARASRCRHQGRVGLIGWCLARHDGHTGLLHGAPGRDLRSHRGDRLRRRTDEHQPRLSAGRREPGILGEEPVPGMHRVGARRPCGVDQAADRQVAFRRRRRADAHRVAGRPDVGRERVGVGVHRDGVDAHLVACAHDAHGDLAAIRHQQPCDHRLSGSLSTSRRHDARRFSRKARSPSWPSADVRTAAMASAVIAATSAAGRSATRAMRAFVAVMARGPQRRNRST
jgi:hypothetical protein